MVVADGTISLLRTQLACEVCGELLRVFRVESNLVAVRLVSQAVSWQSVRKHKLLDGRTKPLEHISRPTFFVQQLHADRPMRLVSAMFASELIKASFQATIEPKVVSIKRQYLASENGVVQPFGKIKLNRYHATIFRLLNDLPSVD